MRKMKIYSTNILLVFIFCLADMNGDGRMDLAIANFKGVFLFENLIKE